MKYFSLMIKSGFFFSFIKNYLLSAYCEPSPMLDAGGVIMNSVPSSMQAAQLCAYFSPSVIRAETVQMVTKLCFYLADALSPHFPFLESIPLTWETDSSEPAPPDAFLQASCCTPWWVKRTPSADSGEKRRAPCLGGLLSQWCFLQKVLKGRSNEYTLK